MSEIAVERNGRVPRLLVVVASFGEKNLEFLRRITRQYRRMTMNVDVVVVSEASKDLDADIKVVVGLPSRNPWSLPFAHKKIFADNLENYDLFAYSEDDMDVTEDHIRAFLDVSPGLASDEIAGFLRYEISHSGIRSLPDAHASFHWRPESIRRRGPYTIAEFTNEHAGFYILTRTQLRRAIASGGFVRAPYKGRYDMLVTAATDPYTSCGFRKVICISRVEDFLINHLSNRYAGRLGTPLTATKEQIQTLMKIAEGLHPASTLLPFEAKFVHSRWAKSFYEEPCHELLALVPIGARRILSVGCGSGDMEVALKNRGAEVTALPLDSVIGAAAEKREIDVVYGTLDQGLEQLGSRTFDCVLISDLLHLFHEPSLLVEKAQQFVGSNGTVVVRGPNFEFYKVVIKRAFGLDGLGRLDDFARSGIKVCGSSTVRRILERSGFRIETVRWFDPSAGRNGSSQASVLDRWTKQNWGIVARRVRSRSVGSGLPPVARQAEHRVRLVCRATDRKKRP
jgi:2-polyprenyl-3-methyl-5-hydroxy-6-metoxy-1,4-benzoquinol methylase